MIIWILKLNLIELYIQNIYILISNEYISKL